MKNENEKITNIGNLAVYQADTFIGLIEQEFKHAELNDKKECGENRYMFLKTIAELIVDEDYAHEKMEGIMFNMYSLIMATAMLANAMQYHDDVYIPLARAVHLSINIDWYG